MNITKPGETEMKAPHVDHNEDLRIALHVERGATSADSEIGVQIIPATPTPQVFRPINGAPMDMGAGPYVVGAVLPLRVTRPVSDLHVSLQDPVGMEIESFNVDGNRAEVHLPQRIDSSKYTLIITFSDRNGQETVVTPVDIVNRAPSSPGPH